MRFPIPLIASIPASLFGLVCLAGAQASVPPEPVAVSDWLGQPWKRLPERPACQTSRAVAVDIDADGILDLFEATGDSYGLGIQHPERLALGTGYGYFTDASERVVGPPTDAFFAEAADLDLDGFPEVFVGGALDPLVLYRNLGGTSLDSRLGGLPSNLVTSFLDLGDVDLDGDPDAFVSGGGGADIFLENSGGVLIDRSDLFPSASGGSFGFALGDVDADGDVDVYVAKTSSVNELFLNEGGSFVLNTPALPSGGGLAPVLDDIDGDGLVDALTTRVLHLNRGGGTFVDASASLPPNGLLATYFAYVDVTGDGIEDVLGEDLYWVLDGAGGFVDQSAQLPAGIEYRPVADLDGDGDADGVRLSTTRCSTSGVIPTKTGNSLLLGDGRGSFREVEIARQRTDDSSDQIGGAPRLADFDGDGVLDLVASGKDDPNTTVEQLTRLFRGDGFGTFTEDSSSIPTGRTVYPDREVADLDGDGDVDILQAGRSSSGGSGGFSDLLRNDGASGFTLVAIPSNYAGTSVELGDLDLDGDLDAALADGEYYTATSILLNNGLGGFGQIEVGPLEHTDETALFDYEGDGDLDVVFSGRIATRLYRNDGGLAFTEVSGVLPSAPVDDLQSGDFDGDGDDDLVAVGAPEGQLWRNDGAAGVTLLATGLESGTTSLFVFDGNGDGLDDLLVWGSEEGLFLSDGTDGFAPTKRPIPSVARAGTARSYSSGDIDRDGDVDLLTSGQVYSSLRRHVSLRGTLKLGASTRVRVWGPPGTPWVLAAAQGTASLSLGDLGELLLDPASLFVLGTGLLDPLGQARFDLAIPNDTALLGTSGYVQAAVGAPLHMTNVDWDVFGTN